MKKQYLLSILMLLFALPIFASGLKSVSTRLDLSGFSKQANTVKDLSVSYYKGVLSLKVPDVQGLDLNHLVAMPIDISQYAGRYAMLVFDLKANCTPIDPSQKSSITAIIAYTSGGKTQYSRFWNSMDKGWAECALVLDKLPTDVSKARLVLGFKNMKGVLKFKKARFYLDNFAKLWEPNLPANFKCEYTKAFNDISRRRGASTHLNITEEQIKKFKSWGGNILRMGFSGAPGDERFRFSQKHANILNSPDYMQMYDKWFEETFAVVKNKLDICAKYNVKVALVLGSYPGFRYWNKDLKMFNEKRYADKFVEIWKRIATDLKGHPAVWCYDLINEPIQTRPYKYDAIKLQYMASKAIREVDPETAICVAAINWSNPDGFETLYPLPLKNIIYQAHMYLPHSHTHYNVGSRPERANPPAYPDAEADNKFLRESLKPIIDFQKKWGAQIYIGEFSCVRWLKGADKYISDCIDIFEENNWHWSYHSFCEASVWNVEFDSNKNNLKPSKVDTPSKKLLLKAYSKNKN